MVRKDRNGGLAVGSENKACCRLESLITVDERGQMVLPKDLRERANIKPGDKLAVISWGKEEGICCLYLIKAEVLGEKVKEFLGPMMKPLFENL
jgi:AbrB family looped-hinge helix DNA binding protein